MVNPNNFGLPIFFNVRGEEDTTKLSEDRYELFVNGKYVGEKTLYTQTDDIHDVEKFLQRQGFSNLETELKGDHFLIHADSSSEAKAMRQALEVYVHNR